MAASGVTSLNSVGVEGLRWDFALTLPVRESIQGQGRGCFGFTSEGWKPKFVANELSHLKTLLNIQESGQRLPELLTI